MDVFFLEIMILLQTITKNLLKFLQQLTLMIQMIKAEEKKLNLVKNVREVDAGHKKMSLHSGLVFHRLARNSLVLLSRSSKLQRRNNNL